MFITFRICWIAGCRVVGLSECRIVCCRIAGCRIVGLSECVLLPFHKPPSSASRVRGGPRRWGLTFSGKALPTRCASGCCRSQAYRSTGAAAAAFIKWGRRDRGELELKYLSRSRVLNFWVYDLLVKNTTSPTRGGIKNLLVICLWSSY